LFLAIATILIASPLAAGTVYAEAINDKNTKTDKDKDKEQLFTGEGYLAKNLEKMATSTSRQQHLIFI